MHFRNKRPKHSEFQEHLYFINICLMFIVIQGINVHIKYLHQSPLPPCLSVSTPPYPHPTLSSPLPLQTEQAISTGFSTVLSIINVTLCVGLGDGVCLPNPRAPDHPVASHYLCLPRVKIYTRLIQ